MENLTIDSGDYFIKIFGDSGANAFAITMSVFIQTVGIVCSSGIVWYQNNTSDNRRTLINKLVKLLAYYTIFLDIFVNPYNFLRVIFGPLPAPLCEFFFFTRAVIFVGVLFTVNEIVILRYLYLCFFRSVGTLNEDFWLFFAAVYNTFFGIVIALCLAITDCYDVPRKICLGQKTLFGFQSLQNDASRFMAILLAGILLLSGILHVVLSCVIILSKYLMKRREERAAKSQAFDASLVDAKVSAAIMAIILLSVSPILFQIQVMKDFESTQFWWRAYIFHWNESLIQLFISGILPLVIFARQEHLRETVFKQIKSVCIK